MTAEPLTEAGRALYERHSPIGSRDGSGYDADDMICVECFEDWPCEIAEAILAGDVAGTDERIAAAASALADAADLLDDADGSADYKRHLIGVHLDRLVRGLLAGERPEIGTGRARQPIRASIARWRASQAHEPHPDFTDAAASNRGQVASSTIFSGV